jgi:ribosome biogenesis protein ENP2
MKCMRGLDSESVKFCILSDDYSKIALANFDRSIELHAQYGKHFKIRVPHFPRDMIYNPFTCDLSVATASNSIYRISLDEGKFLPAFEGVASEVNALDYNGYLNVLLSGGSQGILGIWDYRSR